MEVTIGERGLKKSWQKEFPKVTKCCRCNGEARIGFVAHEGFKKEKKYICNLRPNEGKGSYWLHDCCAVAVYFCKECLETTALYNQA